jgi:putative DNA primase/helicase
LLGTTRNGKGMLMNLLADLMGLMAVPVNPAMLSQAYSGNPNAPSPALMRLRGARLMLCTELQQGRPMDEAFIKQLTGGDKLAGRDPYGGQTEFAVAGKLWISSNHDPEIAYGAEPMWARVVGIPFDVRFEGANDDKDLAGKLVAEASGIMTLLIKQAKLYIARGLPECAEVVEATNALRDRVDTVKSWIDARCRESDEAMVSSDKAYTSYKAHIKEVQRHALTRPAFKSALLKKKFKTSKRNDANYYVGLRLTET